MTYMQAWKSSDDPSNKLPVRAETALAMECAICLRFDIVVATDDDIQRTNLRCQMLKCQIVRLIPSVDFLIFDILSRSINSPLPIHRFNWYWFPISQFACPSLQSQPKNFSPNQIKNYKTNRLYYKKCPIKKIGLTKNPLSWRYVDVLKKYAMFSIQPVTIFHLPTKSSRLISIKNKKERN